ncbi:hypothetical protein [Demequina globuliformis]|uniref:hypothetical protein n=1 Tax=Demequina globuliformis TaxID=676202 RepID=UPI000AB363DA|nr:hypothetical protein [Demequina globuliformis]
MTAHEPRDQDKPIDVDNAADHRPPEPGDPGQPPETDTTNQNPQAKEPNPSQIHKQQRSQGMNHAD